MGDLTVSTDFWQFENTQKYAVFQVFSTKPIFAIPAKQELRWTLFTYTGTTTATTIVFVSFSRDTSEDLL